MSNKSCGLNISTLLYKVASEQVENPFVHEISVFAVLWSEKVYFGNKVRFCGVQW
jgi:hypothetical protein